MFLDLFESEGTGGPNFGLHPHSGIATVTYLAEGDSRYIDPDGSSTQDCDLRIRGSEPEAEVIARINDLLVARKITVPG